jgi:hypothetical protein
MEGMMNAQRSQEKLDIRHDEHDPVIFATLRILEFMSLVGVIYCALGLLMGGFVVPDVSLAIYGAWFILCVEATEAMVQGWRWGAILLGGATLFITVVDIIRGEATLGGATLGIFIAVLIVAYLRDYPKTEE